MRLGDFAKSGGCGCKIGADELRSWLAPLSAFSVAPEELLVDGANCDDAAVWRAGADLAIVASADFFAPVVDDPADFGAIAAANALSDIYAMGAKPLFALALLALPREIGAETARAILNGGRAVCAQAGAPVAGGHTIECAEPLYGLCAVGAAHPEKILTNGGARPGDKLILGKPLGTGLMCAAHRSGELADGEYQKAAAAMKTLNAAGTELAQLPGANALTDVTGFGLLGHLSEMCRASGVGARVYFERLPLFAEAARLAKAGKSTAGGKRNWRAFGDGVFFENGDGNDGDDDAGNDDNGGDCWRREILCDPQTSGGLLLACAPEAAAKALSLFQKHNCQNAAIIGEIPPGKNGNNANTPRITVHP